MRTDNLWRRCPLTTHAVWIFAKRLSFCKGIRGLWFRMPTYNMSCVSPHEPCEGQDVLVHHIQQTSAGKACATSSQGNRAHSKPSDADRTAGTCGSITRALYQCLPDPEADAGASMQLPYLRENSRTISNWKSYSHHSGKYPHLMRARSFIGPCHPIIKAHAHRHTLAKSQGSTYKPSLPDCNISKCGRKTGADRSVIVDHASYSKGKGGSQRRFPGPCLRTGCCGMYSSEQKPQATTLGRTDVDGEHPAADEQLPYSKSRIQKIDCNEPPWAAEPVLRGFPRSACDDYLKSASLNIKDILAAGTGAEALRLLREGLHGAPLRRDEAEYIRMRHTKGSTNRSTAGASCGTFCVHESNSGLLMADGLNTKRQRRAPFFWLDVVKHHSADDGP